MWDNRDSKKSPKHPDFRCKDKNCIDPASGYQTAVWLTDMDDAPEPAGAGPGMPSAQEPRRTKNPAHAFDVKAMKDSIDDVVKLRNYAMEQGLEVPPGETAKWVTTLFIQRMRA